MNDHERFTRLAALDLSEPLTVTDSRFLESHLKGCMSCRREHAALATDHGRLRALVAPRPMAESSRVEILAAVGRPRGRSVAQLLLAAALILLLVAAMAFWAGSRRAPALPTAFAGSYAATNCATWYQNRDPMNIDCDRWGDGATITLDIGPGETAAVRVSTDAGVACSGSGLVDTTPPVVADGTFLFFEITDPTCDLIGLGVDHAAHLYLGPNEDQLWFDDDGDGWGLFWIRSE